VNKVSLSLHHAWPLKGEQPHCHSQLIHLRYYSRRSGDAYFVPPAGNDPGGHVSPWGNGLGGEERLLGGEVHGGSPWQQVARPDRRN
jgi:hypothetical protein